MTRFIHIDHSFTSFGGHEYDYAVNLLQEAEAAGYSIVLATHQSFRDRGTLPEHWQVYSPFPHSIVKSHRHSSAPQYHTQPLLRLIEPLRVRVCRWKANRRHRSFANACRQLFEQTGLKTGDQCFLATFSELDLPGLGEFLSRNPDTVQATWHIQFHFDFALDEPPDSEKRIRLEIEVRSRLREFLACTGTHRVHFYCTTPALAELYNSLGVAHFEYLPFPVNAALQIATQRETGPLCVSIAGGSRREKGIHQLGQTLADVGNDPCLTGKVRFVGQMSPRHHRRLMNDLQQNSPQTQVQFDKLPHPLPTEAYHQLLQSASIGLFLYDKSQYIRRCSGILQETLAAGKPVIVPSDCWLAEQIAEPNYRYLDRLAEDAPVAHTIQPAEITWYSDDGEQIAHAGFPAADSQQMLISLHSGPGRREPYLHGRIEFQDPAGTRLSSQKLSLVRRSGTQPLHSLVTPPPGSASFKLILKNESCQKIDPADEVKIRIFATTACGPHPAGSIGLIAADEDQVALLLREIVSHYGTYFTAAQLHAPQWREAHHPRRSIESIQRNSAANSRRTESCTAGKLDSGDPAQRSESRHQPGSGQANTGTMEKLTVMIPCCNEEATIGACIESVLPFADEILVADSGSTDRTIEVIESYPECRLLRHRWNGYSHFKNWALERATHDWVLCLDADERVTPELAKEICEILKNPPANIAAYSVKFQTYFLGHRVRFSNWNNRSLRLIRRECRFRVCRVHENVDISKDQTGRLEHPVLHYSIHSYDQFFEKYSKYSKLAAEDMYSRGRRASLWSMLFRPFLRFFQLYIIRGGFLDGCVGLQISLFMSFYYSFAKQARLWEMQHAVREPVCSRLAAEPSGTLPLEGTPAVDSGNQKAA